MHVRTSSPRSIAALTLVALMLTALPVLAAPKPPPKGAAPAEADKDKPYQDWKRSPRTPR
jgi:hypothetical protein